MLKETKLKSYDDLLKEIDEAILQQNLDILQQINSIKIEGVLLLMDVASRLMNHNIFKRPSKQLTETITYIEYDKDGKMISIVGHCKAGDLHHG